MTVVTIALRNEKAMQLLQDLADLNLIELVSTQSSEPPRVKLSSLIGTLNTGKTVEELEVELGNLRDEWERTI